MPEFDKVFAHIFYLQDILGYANIVGIFWTLLLRSSVLFGFCRLLGPSQEYSCRVISRRLGVAIGVAAFVWSMTIFFGPAEPPIHGLFIDRWYQIFLGFIVALIGDGSLLMGGAELSTAIRESLSLPILIFRDGYLGQIRMQQLENFGYESETRLQPFDLAAYSRSFGAEYVLGGANLADQLRSARKINGPTIIEIRLEDGDSLKAIRQQSRRKNLLKSAIGPGALKLLRRLRR